MQVAKDEEYFCKKKAETGDPEAKFAIAKEEMFEAAENYSSFKLNNDANEAGWTVKAENAKQVLAHTQESDNPEEIMLGRQGEIHVAKE